MFRNNPDEYYLPSQCSSSSNQQETTNNNISKGNEENVKRLRGLFVDFDNKRAQDASNVDLYQNEWIQFKCDICGGLFNNHMAMKTHRIIKHIVERVYQCDNCEKMFGFKESLAIHKRTCVKPETQKPETKDENAEQNIKLNFMFDFSSIKVGSPSPEINKSSLTCTDCGGSFAKKALLIWHQRHVCK